MVLHVAEWRYGYPGRAFDEVVAEQKVFLFQSVARGDGDGRVDGRRCEFSPGGLVITRNGGSE